MNKKLITPNSVRCLQRDYFDSPFGVFAIESNASFIFRVELVKQAMTSSIPPSALASTCYTQIEEYLRGDRQQFDLPYRLQGSAFQCELWEALRTIPYGQCRSYQDLARQLGRPKAYRAIGSACRANPLLLILPCHRVISASGKIGGYIGGVAMKEHLLRMEQNKKALL